MDFYIYQSNQMIPGSSVIILLSDDYFLNSLPLLIRSVSASSLKDVLLIFWTCDIPLFETVKPQIHKNQLILVKLVVSNDYHQRQEDAKRQFSISC